MFLSDPSSELTRVLQGKTPLDQAEGDSELTSYLSSQQRTPPSATNEDLETAVWVDAHAGLWTHLQRRCTWTEKGLKDKRAGSDSAGAAEVSLVHYLFVFIYSCPIY